MKNITKDCNDISSIVEIFLKFISRNFLKKSKVQNPVREKMLKFPMATDKKYPL